MPLVLRNGQNLTTKKIHARAIWAFKGDVYTGLDADSLSDEDVQFAQHHLRMLSGLYGLLKPLDLMQPYRLESGHKVANPKGKDFMLFGEISSLNQYNKRLMSKAIVF